MRKFKKKGGKEQNKTQGKESFNLCLQRAGRDKEKFFKISFVNVSI